MKSPVEFIPSFLCHQNNIQQKLIVAKKTPDKMRLCQEALKAYQRFCSLVDFEACSNMEFKSTIQALNDYVDFTKKFEKKDKMFNWRSNYAGSVIPEFLYVIIHYALKSKGFLPYFVTKKSVVEISYTGNPAHPILVRHKDQDFGLGFSKSKVSNGKGDEDFVVPSLVIEVKTNIDINKLNGLFYSAESLKKTFLTSRYILATETIDFSLDNNYASGSIDEVYVLRKQVRSQARKQKDPLCEDVFRSLLSYVYSIAEFDNKNRGHVYDRLSSGRLINV